MTVGAVAEAISKVALAFSQVWGYVTGGLTRSDRKNISEAEKLEGDVNAALDKGDVATANRKRDDLERVFDKSTAEHLK